MSPKKLKRLILFGIAIGLAIGVGAVVYMSFESPVEQELKKLIYPGSRLNNSSLSKSREHIMGNWHTDDPISTVQEYYENMGMSFFTPREGMISKSGISFRVINPNILEGGRYRDSFYIRVRLFDRKSGTTIQISLKESFHKSIWSKIVSGLKRLWSKLAGP